MAISLQNYVWTVEVMEGSVFLLIPDFDNDFEFLKHLPVKESVSRDRQLQQGEAKVMGVFKTFQLHFLFASKR
jgi:hypothetical protein